MARYVDVPDEIKITSEMLEPVFAQMIGRWWAQAEYMKTLYGKGSFEYADSLESLWYGLEECTNLASAALDAPHAVISMMNHQRMVDNYIEKELGFSPILSPDTPFRSML